MASQVIFVTQARKAIGRRLSEGSPKISRIAEDLRVSTRTLQRKLAGEGLSYTQLIQQVRLAQACQFLVQPKTPVARIARDSGYETLSSFSRAFHDWTGLSPREFRYRTKLTRNDKFSSHDHESIPLSGVSKWKTYS